jgi:hypothetical protein
MLSGQVTLSSNYPNFPKFNPIKNIKKNKIILLFERLKLLLQLKKKETNEFT